MLKRRMWQLSPDDVGRFRVQVFDKEGRCLEGGSECSCGTCPVVSPDGVTNPELEGTSLNGLCSGEGESWTWSLDQAPNREGEELTILSCRTVQSPTDRLLETIGEAGAFSPSEVDLAKSTLKMLLDLRKGRAR